MKKKYWHDGVQRRWYWDYTNTVIEGTDVHVIDETEDRDKWGLVKWNCQCLRCGLEFTRTSHQLKRKLRSCGKCGLRIEETRRANFKRHWLTPNKKENKK